MGNQIENITANDLNPAFDLLDVQATSRRSPATITSR
jgi:hypothetical protein